MSSTSETADVKEQTFAIKDFQPFEILVEDNWCYFKVDKIDEKLYNNPMATNEIIKNRPEPHVTLFYGFDPSKGQEVKAKAESFKLCPADIFYETHLRKGDVERVVFLGIKSPAIQTAFAALSSEFPNTHMLINGKYDPHVTVAEYEVPHKRLYRNMLNPNFVHQEGGQQSTQEQKIKQEFQCFANQCLTLIPNVGNPQEGYDYPNDMGDFHRLLKKARNALIDARMAFYYKKE